MPENERKKHLFVKDVEDAVSKDSVSFFGHVVRIGNIGRQLAPVLQTRNETGGMFGRGVIGHEVRCPSDASLRVQIYLVERTDAQALFSQRFPVPPSALSCII